MTEENGNNEENNIEEMKRNEMIMKKWKISANINGV